MILETIAEATRKRVAAEKEKCSLAEMKEKATAMNGTLCLIMDVFLLFCFISYPARGEFSNQIRK